MKKSILLISGLGIGVGVLYALGSRGASRVQQTSNGNGNNNQPNDDATENGKQNRPSLTLASNREADEAKKSSMKSADSGTRASEDENVLELDDQGTNQAEASEILKSVRDAAFESSNENLALALGRPVTEIEEEIEGTAPIDGDELMKARKLAMARGVNFPE